MSVPFAQHSTSSPGAKARRHFSLAVAACLCLACPAPGFAAGESAPVQTAQTRAQVQAFAIPAGPLSNSLTTLSRSAGLTLAVDPALVAGKTAPAVSGTYTPEEALQRLLAGSGLGYSMSGTTVAVGRPGELNADGTVTLNPITVAGQLESAYGPVTGYVASRTATGTKTDTPLIEVPQSVSVIPTAQMEDRNVQVESQALLYSAGVVAQPYGDSLNTFNNFYYIRGFPTSFGGSYVDGTVSPVNYRFEPYGFERIEVLRGPASGLFGQADPGGIVNRVSKRPRADARYEGVLEYNNFDTPQLSIDATGALDEENRFLYRLTGTASSGHIPTRDLRFDQELDQERVFLAPSFTWNISPDTSFTALAKFHEDNSEELSVFIAPGYNATNIRLDGNPGTEYHYRDHSIGYEFDHRIDDTLKVNQAFRYSRMNYDYDALFQSNGVNDPFDGVTIARYADGFAETREDIAVDTRVQKDLAFEATDHTLLAGFDFQRLEDAYTFSFGSATTLNLLNPDYSTPFIAGSDYISEKSTTYNYGLYIQDQIKIDEDWILTLGVRQDWSGGRSEDMLAGGTTKRDDNATSYRAGLGYEFENGLVPYVSYAESFLPTSGSDFNGTPFKPTIGRQFEGGIKYQPTDFPGFFTVAAYDLTKENVTTRDPVNSGFSIQTGETRSRGIELEATAEIYDNIRLQAAYTSNYTKVTKSNNGNEGDEASLAPRNVASVWMDYQFPVWLADGLSLGGGVRFVGRNYAFDRTATLTDRHRNKDTTLVDAAIRYDLGKLAPALENTEAALNVSNLFDTAYQVCYSRFNCQVGEPLVAMGRLTIRR